MVKYLPYITAIIAIGGFVFSVWKYIDLKNREEKRLEFENLNNLINYISGDARFDNNKSSVMTSKYIANIYQLSLFKNQSFIIIPFLDYLKEYPLITDENSQIRIKEAIDYVIDKLN